MEGVILSGADFQAWAADGQSGASGLTRAAWDLVRSALQARPHSTSKSLLESFRLLGRTHPAVGSLWRLLDRLTRVMEKCDREGAAPEDRNHHLREGGAAFVMDLQEAEIQVVARSLELVPANGLLALYSRSSLVERAARLAWESGVRFRVVMAEGRPAMEGRGLAESLARLGIPVLLTTDAMLPMLVERAQAVWLGADALTPSGLLHKAGTWPLLLAAREHNVPAYCLAPRAKFVATDRGGVCLPQRSGSAIWPDPPAGVQPLHLPFDSSPLALLRGVRTENDFLPPGEAREVALGARLARALVEGS